MRRQPVTESSQRIDQRRTVCIIVHQQNRLLATGLPEGNQHCAQPAQKRLRRWHRIGGGAGWTGRRALAAAGADVGIDGHMVASWRDGARGAEIEAARAADDPGARMGAQSGVEHDIPGLFEGADEVSRAEDRSPHRGGVAGIGAQIAVPQIRGGNLRPPAGKVENDVATRPRTIARCPERRRRLSEIVDHDVEGANVAADRPDPASCHRKVRRMPWRNRRWRLDEHGDVEMLLEQLPGPNRLLAAAIDENDATALDLHHGDRRHRLARRRKERRHHRCVVAGGLGIEGHAAVAGVGTRPLRRSVAHSAGLVEACPTRSGPSSCSRSQTS